MFIQRLSGPTIGFYCLDIFEITYSTYASVCIFIIQIHSINCFSIKNKILDYRRSWPEFLIDH